MWPGHLPLLRTPASQPRRPPEVPAQTEGTLWRPWQACMGLCIQGCVPRCASLWDCLSRSVVSVWLVLSLSFPRLDVCPCLCIPTSMFVQLSMWLSLYLSPCALSLSFLSLSRYTDVSLYRSLCVWVFCVSRSLSSLLCVTLSPWTCLSPLLRGSVSVVLRVSCVSVFVSLSPRLCLYVSM